MKTFAFVFARGGSKGLPRKNIKLLAGKPLIQYSIEVAKSCPYIEQVFVSTDDQEIAEVAKAAGATVIMRPDELATDNAPEWLAWRHAIDWVREYLGDFSEFVSLPATAPLRSVDDVTRAIIKRRSDGADICISMTPANRSPYFNMVKLTADGMVELVNKPEQSVFRRQDAPVVFDITTVAYVATPEYILNNMGLFEGKTTAIEVPKERAVDIDDIYDFKFAEILLAERKND